MGRPAGLFSECPVSPPLQLNQGIPTGGRRRPLAGEVFVKVVVFDGEPRPVAFHAYARWEVRRKAARHLRCLVRLPQRSASVVATFRPSDEFHSPGNRPETSYEGRIRRLRVLEGRFVIDFCRIRASWKGR